MRATISIVNGNCLSDIDFAAGRIALENAFKLYLLRNGIEPIDNVVIDNYQSGQPYINIKEYKSLFCSIGHSYGLGVGAIAPFKIGVDVEKIRPHTNLLVNYISDQDEQNLVKDFFAHKTDKITLIWTIKESVMKGLGVGFKIPPKKVKIVSCVGKFFEVEVLDSEVPDWCVFSIGTEAYYISVAYEKKHGQKKFHNWVNEVSISFADISKID